jgi:hypothetical protein
MYYYYFFSIEKKKELKKSSFMFDETTHLSWLFSTRQHLHLDRMDRRERQLVGTEK